MSRALLQSGVRPPTTSTLMEVSAAANTCQRQAALPGRAASPAAAESLRGPRLFSSAKGKMRGKRILPFSWRGDDSGRGFGRGAQHLWRGRDENDKRNAGACWRGGLLVGGRGGEPGQPSGPGYRSHGSELWRAWCQGRAWGGRWERRLYSAARSEVECVARVRPKGSRERRYGWGTH